MCRVGIAVCPMEHTLKRKGVTNDEYQQKRGEAKRDNQLKITEMFGFKKAIQGVCGIVRLQVAHEWL